MPIQFSPVIAARQLSLPGFSSFLSFDLDALGVAASSVAVLDDFRVFGLPLCPHPHQFVRRHLSGTGLTAKATASAAPVADG